MAVYLFLAPIGHTNIIFSICNVVGDWTMLILPCFPNSNAFLVCFYRVWRYQWHPVEIWQSQSGARDLQLGCYSNLEGRNVACGGWRHDASSRGKERGPMERAFERKGPRVSPMHSVQTESHRRDIEVAQDVSTIRKASVWLRIRVEGVPSPCIVWMFHALSATFPRPLDQTALKPTIIFPWSSLVASNFVKFNINPLTCSTQMEDRWNWHKCYVCICLHRHVPDDVRLQFDLC